MFAGGDDGIRTHDPLLAGQVLSQLSYTPILNECLLFLRFLHIVKMVGPSGLEPPTSCLSGTRSNLLSYEPMQLSLVVSTCGGDDGIRTHDPLLAGQVLSQLSYTPI